MSLAIARRLRRINRRATTCAKSDHDPLVEQVREVCHDLRQPIAAVMALSAAALASPELPEHTRDNLRQIVRQTEWLADMVFEGLSPEADPSAAGTGPGARAWVLDLAGLVDEVASGERMTYGGELALRRDPEPLLVHADRVGLRRVVANLLSNATRAAGPLGHVLVELRRDADRVLLVIEDDGPGFGRIPRGPGLGLGIVTRQLTGYDGRLDFGTGSSGGAQARLSLPVPAAGSPENAHASRVL